MHETNIYIYGNRVCNMGLKNILPHFKNNNILYVTLKLFVILIWSIRESVRKLEDYILADITQSIEYI